MWSDLDLKRLAAEARLDFFTALGQLGGGHYGACLSVIDLLTYLYFQEMNIDPANPAWPERDLFVLSKGHAGFGLYAVLAARGFFPKSRLSAYENGVMLPKHADKHRIPGVELSTGSLGIGFSAAVGMAVSLQRSGSSRRVYTLLGDGELNEGIVWEAAMAASKYGLDNLTAVIDYNKLQFDGDSNTVMGLEPLAARWQSFGWQVTEIDGHDFPSIARGFDFARSVSNAPQVLIAHTVKGKGVPFMEGQTIWHGGTCSPEQLEEGLRYLQAQVASLRAEKEV